jgi:hypothetical protein
MGEPAWRVPGYLLDEPLGAGADARVWRGRVRRGGDPVAIKLLPVLGRDQLAAARAEAAVLIGLDHPHLVHLHEAVPCAQGLALVLDLADGGSLAGLLQRRGRLTPGEVVAALAPIGAALAYAHNAGVVHGDVSAANVLFTAAGLPLLADLGIARLADASTGEVGDDDPNAPARSTPAYIDPVVAAGGVPAASSDVFMLAAVALHALTGRPPWPGVTAGAALAAAATGELGDVTARLRAAGVPEPVATVLRGGLEHDPARRPTAAEFALDLRHAAEPAPVELRAGRARHRAEDSRGASAMLTYGHRVPPPARAPAWTWRSRAGSRAVRLAVSALVLSGVGGGVLWWVSGGHDDAVAPLAQARPAASGPARPAAGPAGSTTAGRAVAAATAELAATSGPAAETGGAGPARALAGSRLDAAQAAQVLRSLDALRARAYAERDPSLLAQVYTAGPLLTQDSAQLRSIVPSGCGLDGATTSYTRVVVTDRSPGEVTLRARAALHASRLRCAGKPAGQAPGAGPRTLRIELRSDGTSYRIGGLER